MAIITTSWVFDFAILNISIFSAVYLFFQKRYKHWGILNVPHTNPEFPFGDIGKSFLFEGLHTSLTRIYRSFRKEKVVGIWNFFSPVLLVIDLDVVRDVLVKNFTSFHDRGFYVSEKDPLAGYFLKLYGTHGCSARCQVQTWQCGTWQRSLCSSRIIIDLFSANLFTLSGAKWRNIRAKLSPTFTSGKMKMMFPILVNCSNEFAEVLDKFAERGDVVEMKEHLGRFTTDAFSSSVFGIEANSLKDPEAVLRKMGKRVMEPSLPNAIRSLIFLNPLISEIFQTRVLDSVTAKFFTNAIREAMDYRKATRIHRNDFIQLLLQLMDKGMIDDENEISGEENMKDKVVQKITFEEAAGEAFGFFLAGFETASSAMQFVLYELSLNPDIQDELRAEIKSELAKNNGNITYEAVYKIELLGRVINETLRKYPPVAFLSRQCNQDFKIKGTDFVIPKGTNVQIPIYAIHYDPEYYPNPDRFDPDRFKEEIKSKRHHYAHLPFGDGPRNCIGMRFGLMQTKVGLVKLLSCYKFEICEKSPVPMVLDPQNPFLNPKNGMHLRILKI